MDYYIITVTIMLAGLQKQDFLHHLRFNINGWDIRYDTIYVSTCPVFYNFSKQLLTPDSSVRTVP